MLRTFRAWLKGSRLEWIDEIPEFGNRLIQVHVTLLENEPDLQAKSRGRKKPVRIVHFQDDKMCFLTATSSSTLLNPNTLN
jgi:hypothetical protein